MVVPEGLLDRVECPMPGQPLDSENVCSVGLDGQHQTGPRRLAIDEDGARATDALLAAHADASKTNVLTEKIRKQLARRHCPLKGLPVDRQADGKLSRHRLALLFNGAR